MFFSTIKSVYGQSKPNTTPLLSADGMTIIKVRVVINERLRENFSNILNHSSTVAEAMFDSIPQQSV